MANVLVRDLPDEAHVQLKARAKKNGRSVNAEIVAALDQTLTRDASTSAWAQIEARKKEFLEEGENFEFEVVRDKTPARIIDFSGPEYDWPEPK